MSLFFDQRFEVYRQRETVKLPRGGSVRLNASGATKGACRAEFERKRHDAIAEAERGAVAPPKGTKLFSTFAYEWLATYPAAAKNRETTLIEKTYHVRVRLIPYFERLAEERGGAPYTLGELTARVIDKMIADLGQAPKMAAGPADQRARALKAPRPLSAQTVRNILQTFRKMMISAKRWDEIDMLPEIASVKAPRAKFEFLTFDETERLLGATLGMEDLALLMTGVKAGLRAGELLGLHWSDLDFVKREIRIDAQLAHRGIRRVPVKAGARTVPMSPKLAAILQRLRHLRGPWVFCDADGVPFTRSDLKRKLEYQLKRAGLRRIHPHAMRHTFASHLIMHGVSVPQVREWLGHASIAMTMRYAHLAPGVGASAINALDQEAGPAKESHGS